MKIPYRITATLIIALLVSSIGFAQDNVSTDITIIAYDEAPTIYAESTFEVDVSTHIYAQGLSHETWGGDETTVMDLQLDLYEPIDAPDNRPAMIIAHGGGYIGGSPRQQQLVDMATYFAERGWVVVSIQYRLVRDRGTVPDNWLNAVIQIEGITRQQQAQVLAIYTGSRDAKAAVRWLYANAEAYQINTDYITSLGGSAGAGLAIMLGITDDEHYRDELTLDDDPTLESTHLDYPSQVHTIINFWGTSAPVELQAMLEGAETYDETDAPMMIVHGTADPTVDFSEAELLHDAYEQVGVPVTLYAVEGGGHGLWNRVIDEKNLRELTYDFIIEQQNLTVNE